MHNRAGAMSHSSIWYLVCQYVAAELRAKELSTTERAAQNATQFLCLWLN
jgi:hypothetical protein